MKRRAAAWLLAAALTATLQHQAALAQARSSAPVSGSESRFIDAKSMAAASLAVQQAYAGLASELSGSEALAQAILAAPANHAKPQASRARLAASEHYKLRQAFTRQLHKFAQGMSRLPQNWVANTLQRQEARLHQQVTALIDNHINAQFAVSRRLAVSEQRQLLQVDVLPPAADIEDIVLADLPGFMHGGIDALAQFAARHGRTLVRRMVDKAQHKQPLLMENRAHMAQLAGAAVRARMAALWRQLNSIRQHNGAGAVDRETAAANMQRDLERLAAPAAKGEPWSGIFQLAQRETEARAARLEQAATVAAVAAWFRHGRCEQLLNPPMREVAQKAPGDVPPSLAAHEQRLYPRLAKAAWDEVVQTLSARVRDAGRRQRLRDRLLPLKAQPETALNAFEWSFDTCLGASLSAARQAIAERELAQLLPAIAGRTLALEENAIAKAVREERPIALPGRERLRLQESGRLFDERQSELANEAVAAYRRQLTLAGEPARVARFRAEIEALASADRTATAKAEFAGRYLAQVAAQWQKVQPDTVIALGGGRTNGKYLALFDRIEEEVERLITLEWRKAVATAAQETVVVSAMPLEEEQPPPVPVATVAAVCPDPSCEAAAHTCARFATACEDGSCGAQAMQWRAACLTLAQQCAGSN
ncbi:MAG: hypothetical protein GKR94_34570 [Gammaproteobacteria bacterium]|nr:hypothetical protein [Gammaproteobacteria bacterium]